MALPSWVPSWMTSSADEEKLALTIKGVLTWITPLILYLSNVKGWHLTQSDLDVAIDSVLSALAALVGLIGAIMTVVGALRKIYYAIKGGDKPAPGK